ncbi:cytochrome b/b6 domain-containing protein [Aerolutibacter ruishenii]|uniref:Cytochrome b n=1 Tax=Aerolutibacter ruishenii TaxID=686800 RepID=A0A562LY17_9GAMM|nr:cytochrome b/b6 domain-containing protein [Lysobacter ruishenii]TWI12506.1 cytochrome b [Lysobacter ruishenii]
MNTILQHASDEPAGTAAKTAKVWDPLVRLFHWSLAACILGAFLVEEGDTAHRWLGYTALGLIAFRVLWGLVGSRHARFSDWVHGPRAVATYLRERLTGRSQRRLGHNPAAAVMILVLMAGVAAVGLTGWMQTLDAYWGAEWLEELHEALANGLLVLVGVHVLAAIVESLHYRENLIAAMVHGRKRTLDHDRH